METTTTEVADGVFRFATFLPDAGIEFCQFLVRGDEPLLFHTGPRAMFDLVRSAVDQVLPAESIRWIAFGHVESDECGSMNDWLALAPRAEVAAGGLATMVNLADLADRPPHVLGDGDVLDIGGHRLRHIDTPHVPHCWDARVLFDETTSTLFCGDLFTSFGVAAGITEDDLVEGALAAEDAFGATCLTPTTGATIRSLAACGAQVLAPMHAPAFHGDAAGQLAGLADAYDARVAAAR